MNFLYSRNNGKFHIVLSDKNCPNLYTDIDITTLKYKDYSPNILLADDEWYKTTIIKSEIGDPLELLSRQVNTSLNTITKDQYVNILYLVYRENSGDYFYLQKIRSNEKMFGKRKLSFSNQPEIFEQPIIAISEIPDAIYQISSNTLFFKHLGAMNSIFSGINELYREATNQEVDEFLALDDLLDVESSFDTKKIKIPTRKNLAYALDVYKSLDTATKTKLHAYISSLQLPSNDDGKYLINSEESLNDFICAIQEKFYTTEATKEKRLAQAYQKR